MAIEAAKSDVRRRLAAAEELRQGRVEMQATQERMESEAARRGEEPPEDAKAGEESKVVEEKGSVELEMLVQ